MGQIGFGELFVILIVAICVLKPEQLQQSTFLLGKIWGKTIHQIKKLKDEFKQNYHPPSF